MPMPTWIGTVHFLWDALFVGVLVVLWAALCSVLEAVDQRLRKKGPDQPVKSTPGIGLFALIIIAAIAWSAWKYFHWNL